MCICTGIIEVSLAVSAGVIIYKKKRDGKDKCKKPIFCKRNSN